MKDQLTYRFPRTVTDAFGCDATTACAIEHHRNHTYHLAKWMMRAIYLVAAVGTIALGVLS